MISDDAILEMLHEALVPPGLAPGPDELARLHRSLGANARSLRPQSGLSWGAHLSRRLVVAGAVAGAFMGLVGGGVAFDALPGPLRTVAYDLGLPVSSPALVAAQGAETTLRQALVARDRPEVSSDAALLRQRLGALDPADRLRAVPEGMALLAQADALLGAVSPSAQPAPPPTVTAPVQERPATTTTEPAQARAQTTTTEPAQSRVETTTTEPAQSRVETTTTEPAQSRVETTTTEPAQAPAQTTTTEPAQAPAQTTTTEPASQAGTDNTGSTGGTPPSGTASDG